MVERRPYRSSSISSSSWGAGASIGSSPNQQLCAAERFEKTRITAVAACESKFLTQPRPAMIENRTVMREQLAKLSRGHDLANATRL